MPLHLLKLCVGATSVADLEDWIAERLDEKRRLGLAVEQVHTTRMVPTRVDELLDGGSLYWVIKGEVACRQKLTDVRPFVDADGIRRCHLVLDPAVLKVAPRPSRPFQGWRYLKAQEAPADLREGTGGEELPEEMRRELRALGLM
ncbi:MULTISPECIES: DUF1489 family protein [Azorhizobium]|uniref:Uncharacterized conserved protein n=1 Tax=Azorhizobium caulinodans (strain ATCC 43989 / DSM 5975 / JCM 20966 / LMG 6465 / NBRC 14845 / NCIMB 13405 / ORS 571) TaxID=438753 RepID=A8I9T3_AZOC5|nr:MULTISPECIES: DUF1489 family protein [Azorhizobium]TDT90327.1 hypothetical protein DFO45_4182 [Azorhizobium sp. AG788]BAF88827.1 uncharacterized conserved protein [Azorhizobium caulinodans ORS 571]